MSRKNEDYYRAPTPPEHYRGKDGIQPFDIIDAFDLGFNLGNVIKYVCRAGKKGERLADLQKARTYLLREINAAALPPTVKPLGEHHFERSLVSVNCLRCGNPENHSLHPVVVTREELVSETPAEKATRWEDRDDA